MLLRLAADAVLIVHLAFVLFAVLGALFALRWRWIALAQLPAAAWAFYIEASGGFCPLTGLENRLRAAAGQAGYSGGFVEHYLVPVLYPAALTRDLQIWLALIVVAANAAVYGWLLRTLWRELSASGRDAPVRRAGR